MSHIHDEIAYNRAVKTRIINNARTTFLKDENNSRAIEFAYDNQWNNFCKSMIENFERWGKLSPKQVQALLNMVDKNNQRKVERERAYVAKCESSEYFGEIKKRYDLVLMIRNKIHFQGTSYSYYDSGERTMYVLEDSEGHVFKYIGDALAGVKGDEVTLKATVKEHTEYKGMKQTVLSRPKLNKLVDGETGKVYEYK